MTITLAAFIARANEGSQVLFWNFLSMALRSGGIFLPLSFAIFAPGTITALSATPSLALSTVAALAAVAAVRTAGSNIFFTVKRNCARAAVAGFDLNFCYIYKHRFKPFL